jgi:N-acetylglucosaminyldiphosphoundecaprenol N-acetyl-beta-D-mannosaminyltransferase
MSSGLDERIPLLSVDFNRVTEAEVVAHVMAALADGDGGRIVTPNADILRMATREPEAREHIDAATLVVADGTPLVWASRLSGHPLPERVAGASLLLSLSAALAERGGSVYLLGGAPGAAERAARSLRRRFPGLVIAGWHCPAYGFEAHPAQALEVRNRVIAARPDLVCVGLGFPKQERVIADLRPYLPASWFLGCGAAIGFAAGTLRRAPRWMQRAGLEWLWRLGSEPRRLARRYLVHDAPFAVRLLAYAVYVRLRRR